MNDEAKCFVRDTCTEWEVDQTGKRTFCKSWPTGYKNYLADLSALMKTLEDLQPACPKRTRREPICAID